MPGEPLRPGAIYNSNRFTLRGLIEALGCVCDDLGIVPDNLGATRDALRRAAAGNDLIVTCGGVSVGEEDHLKPAVQAEGDSTSGRSHQARQATRVRQVRREAGAPAVVHRLPATRCRASSRSCSPSGRSC
jgi:molybdopterin-biosynthesis enzyme MoeA-like protein